MHTRLHARKPAAGAAPSRAAVKHARSPAPTALGNQSTQRSAWSTPSGKLVPIGRRSDPSERAATRTAEAIESGGAGVRLAIPPHASLHLLGGSGRTLDATERQRFDRHFDGLKDVRIHEGPDASSATAQLRARAIAAGSEVAFASGQYQRGTSAGDRLLAHELAHLAQGDGVIRRQPVELSDEEEEEEEQAAPIPQPSLLSIDYSGPQACGGRPCVTDEMISQVLNRSAVEEEMVAAIAAQVPAPSAQVGQFGISVGPLLEEQPAPPGSGQAAVVGTATNTAPQGTPKPAAPTDPKIVLGAYDKTGIEGAASMQKATGQEIVPLDKGALAGADEISLIAHGDQKLIDIGKESLTPKQLARRLYKAGWRGSVIRLIACDAATVTGAPTYAQNLANELAELGVETTVIAPRGKAAMGGIVGGLPRVLPPGAQKLLQNLRRLGQGWNYFTAERPPGQALPWRHPGTWTGAGWTGGKMAAAMVLSYIHSRAVAQRVEEEREKTGFADWGPTGDTLYDLGAWFLDPTDEAGRSIPLSQRFDMPVWRRNFIRRAAEQPVGKKWKVSWTTNGDPDPTWGNPTYRKFYGIYIKRPDGYWSTWGCKDCEGDDFPPDINKIIDPLVSDEELREYLELPSPYESSGLA